VNPDGTEDGLPRIRVGPYFHCYELHEAVTGDLLIGLDVQIADTDRSLELAFTPDQAEAVGQMLADYARGYRARMLEPLADPLGDT